MVFRVVALGIDQPSAAWRVGMGGSKRAVAWPSHSRKLQSLPATCFQLPASSFQHPERGISDVVHVHDGLRCKEPTLDAGDMPR